MSSQAGADLGVKVQAQAKRRADDDLPVQGTRGREVASEMRADRAARLQRPGPRRPSPRAGCSAPLGRAVLAERSRTASSRGGRRRPRPA